MTTFPTSPTKGQKFTVGTNEYRWSGSVWLLVHKQMPLGPTGPTGSIGPTGTQVSYETGSIHLYAGYTLPGSSGEWLYCDGSTLNASTNTAWQALYNVIGTAYGGTNNTNFVLPNLCVGTSLGLSGYTFGTGYRRMARGRLTTSTVIETVGGTVEAGTTSSDTSHTHTNSNDNIAISSYKDAGHNHYNAGLTDHGHFFNMGGAGSQNLAYGAAANYVAPAAAGHYHYGGGNSNNGSAGGGGWGYFSFGHTHNSNTSLIRAATTGGTSHSHTSGLGHTDLFYIIKT
jgi:microcystin-dependent protein